MILRWIDVNGRNPNGNVQLRECVSMGAVGAQTRRSFGHHLLHLQILRLLVLLKLADFAPADPNITALYKN